MYRAVRRKAERRKDGQFEGRLGFNTNFTPVWLAW